MLRTSRGHDIYQASFVRPVAALLSRLDVTGTALSGAALVIAAVGAAAFVVEPAWGGVLYLLSGLVDTLDGAVSRRAGSTTRAGAFLDSLFDRYAELLILLGVLGFYVRADLLTPLVAFVVLLAAYGSWMVSYAQSRAEGLGADCSFGLFERPERLLLLSVGAIGGRWIDIRPTLPDFLATRPILGISLILLAAGTLLTSITRLRRGYRVLSRDDDAPRAIPHD